MVTRRMASSGNVCAGASYRAGSKFPTPPGLAVIGDTVEIFIGNEPIRSHKAKARPHP